MKLGFRSRLFSVTFVLVLGVALVSSAMIQNQLDLWGERQSQRDFLRRSQILSASISTLDQKTQISILDSVANTTHATLVFYGPKNRQLYPTTAQPLPSEIKVTELSLNQVTRVNSQWFVKLPVGSGQVLLVGQETKVFERDMGQLRWLLLFSGLLGIVAILALSAVATYLMSRTLRRLINHATGLRHLDPKKDTLSLPEDDFGVVLMSMTTLSETVADSMKALATERDRFEGVLESMEEGIVALNREMQIQVMNGVAKRFLATPLQAIDYDFEGRLLLNVVKHAPLVEMVERVRAGDLHSVEQEMELPGASDRLVIARLTRVGGEQGGSVLVFRDVSELRALETVRRDFVANVSHELKTPASVIMLNSETLMSDDRLVSEPAAKRFVDGIHRNAERLSRIIDDLLDISRIEAGVFRLNREPVSLFGATLRVIDVLEEQLHRRDQTADLQIDLELLVFADAKALDQMLYNLIDNASKYAPHGSEVLVRAEEHKVHGQDATFIRLEVCDHGPGLAPEHRPRIFERFYRVDDGRSRDAGGTGLGLSIVKLLATAQEGRVGVKPNRPEGSIFWFYLPKAAPEDEPEVDDVLLDDVD